MTDSTGKKRERRTFSGSHQRSWLWGHHAVAETLRAGNWPVLQVFATREALESSAELKRVHSQATVPFEIVPASRLEQLVHSTEHQGVIARLVAFPYSNVEHLLANWKTPTNPTGGVDLPPLIVVCDRIQDAFNFGAILRCCDGAAVLGVIVSDKSQAEVTPHVVRASSGAANYVPIVRCDDLIAAVQQFKRLGTHVVAADSNANARIWETPLDEPTLLIVGSEAHGVRPDLLALSDYRICIPMLGRVTSLNAAVATGILLYEIRRQQFGISSGR
jgi:23S rRNA (guanosine2251-2'-O)-methyltransferase